MRIVKIGSLSSDLPKTFGAPTEMLSGDRASLRFERHPEVKFAVGSRVFQYNLGMFWAPIEQTWWTHGLEIFVDSKGRVLGSCIDYV